MSIAIITDSTCDLPAEAARRYHITVIPMTINIEGRSYRDEVDITRAEYYARLPQVKTLPTTSASGAADFEKAYRECQADEIVSIHIGATLSGVLNMARLGAEASGRRVTLVDSQQASMGLGWQAVAAAEAALSGSVEKVLEVIAAVRRRVRVLALLDTFEYLRRGGRANAVVATLGDLLQIKPLIQVAEGKVTSLARPRTHSRGFDKLVELVEQMGPLDRLAVLHAHNLEGARRLEERVARYLRPGASPLIRNDVTAIVGTHAGPGAIGVAVVPAA